MQMLFAKNFLTLEGVIICVLMSHLKVTEDRVVGYNIQAVNEIPCAPEALYPFPCRQTFFVPTNFPVSIVDYNANGK